MAGRDGWGRAGWACVGWLDGEVRRVFGAYVLRVFRRCRELGGGWSWESWRGDVGSGVRVLAGNEPKQADAKLAAVARTTELLDKLRGRSGMSTGGES